MSTPKWAKFKKDIFVFLLKYSKSKDTLFKREKGVTMIKAGYCSTVTDWGNYRAVKVANLSKPVECLSNSKGKALFNPTIVKLEWETPPSEDKHEFWFPYWITWSDVTGRGQRC